jgi:hypothetical protein
MASAEPYKVEREVSGGQLKAAQSLHAAAKGVSKATGTAAAAVDSVAGKVASMVPQWGALVMLQSLSFRPSPPAARAHRQGRAQGARGGGPRAGGGGRGGAGPRAAGAGRGAAPGVRGAPGGAPGRGPRGAPRGRRAARGEGGGGRPGPAAPHQGPQEGHPQAIPGGACALAPGHFLRCRMVWVAHSLCSLGILSALLA